MNIEYFQKFRIKLTVDYYFAGSIPPSVSAPQVNLDEHDPPPPYNPSYPPSPSKSIDAPSTTNYHNAPAYDHNASNHVGPHQNYSLSLKPGMSKCGNSSCVTCDLILEGTTFKSTMTGKSYKFMTPVTCESKHVIYLVSKSITFNMQVFLFCSFCFTDKLSQMQEAICWQN